MCRFLLALFLFSVSYGSYASGVSVPFAPQKPKELKEHGSVRTDPFFWLRERTNPEVKKYLQEENEYAVHHLGKLRGIQDQIFF